MTRPPGPQLTSLGRIMPPMRGRSNTMQMPSMASMNLRQAPMQRRRAGLPGNAVVLPKLPSLPSPPSPPQIGTGGGNARRFVGRGADGAPSPSPGAGGYSFGGGAPNPLMNAAMRQRMIQQAQQQQPPQQPQQNANQNQYQNPYQQYQQQTGQGGGESRGRVGKGGRLTAAQRAALPDSAFAGPNRSFPITDAGHARAAKALIKHAPASARPKIEARANAKLGKKPAGKGGGNHKVGCGCGNHGK